MSLVASLQVWKEAVQCYNEGDFQNALQKFKNMNDSSAKITFNIGRVYMSLCELQKSLQAFQSVIKKDEHLAIGHFMLGVVNLMCSRYADALVNFNETFRNLRESKFIDYKQLGMRYKLYKCEVLLNRAVCLSSLGYMDSAVEDLLAALQCKAEPRHNIIDISLENIQTGKSIEFIVMDAIFQPPRSKTANLEKIDYLGKAQVVVDTGTYETMNTPLLLRDSVKTNSADSGELYRVLYDFTAQNASEVTVKVGDLITITEKADDGWFTMVTKDAKKTGLVPGSYLEKVREEKTKNTEKTGLVPGSFFEKVRDEKPKHNGQTLTSRQALLTDLRKKESRQSLRRVQPPPTKQPPRLPPGAKTTKPEEGTTSARLSHSKSSELNILNPTSGNTSPKSSKFPKFRRQRSLENLLGMSPSPSNSPTWVRKLSDPPKLPSKQEESDSDNEGYEKIDDDMVEPYAIHDVISPKPERTVTNGRKGPERPVPPPKAGFTFKPRNAPPVAAPQRFPRANTVSLHGSAYDQKFTPMFASATPFPRPVKTPPRPPPSPKNARKKNKEQNRSQTVDVQFIVSTSLRITPSTTPEDIQTSVKEAINKNVSSHLWCEKDGKKIRLDDQKVKNILDLVKDGKLTVWCFP